jgi:cell division control protein 6
MPNVFESNKQENAVFRDERFLYPDFVPERLPFRDKEVSELVFCLKPASLGRKPTNVFVFGKPGTGKTVTLRFVLNELEEFSDRAKGVYINCFQLPTKQAILSRLCNSLGYAVPQRGMSFEELWSKFIAVIKSKKSVPIIIFDEAEQLLNSSLKDLLYEFSRLGEQHKVVVGLAFVSNDDFFLSKIDDRVRSSLQCSSIPFEPYSVPELKEILAERAKYAFTDFALDSDVVGLCAAHAAKLGGDARVAVSVLLKAGRLAERENAKKVLIKHVRASFMQEKPVKVEVTSTLSEQEKEVLNLLDTSSVKEVDSGFVYSSLEKKFSERALRYALSELESKGIIVSSRVLRSRGFTRVFKRK